MQSIQITAAHILSHHITLHQVTSYRVLLHHIVSIQCHHITSYGIKSHNINWHYIQTNHIKSHRIKAHQMTSNDIISHHFIPWHIIAFQKLVQSIAKSACLSYELWSGSPILWDGDAKPSLHNALAFGALYGTLTLELQQWSSNLDVAQLDPTSIHKYPTMKSTGALPPAGISVASAAARSKPAAALAISSPDQEQKRCKRSYVWHIPELCHAKCLQATVVAPDLSVDGVVQCVP
jgi:hypothetical protein